MNSMQKDLAELRARFPAADMGAERERITILDRLQESARTNAERLEASACPACRGTGKFPGRGGTEDCVRCNGSGTVWTEGAP